MEKRKVETLEISPRDPSEQGRARRRACMQKNCDCSGRGKRRRRRVRGTKGPTAVQRRPLARTAAPGCSEPGTSPEQLRHTGCDL